MLLPFQSVCGVCQRVDKNASDWHWSGCVGIPGAIKIRHGLPVSGSSSISALVATQARWIDGGVFGIR